MRMPANQVLIKLDREQDEYIMGGGQKLYIDPSFEPEKHAPIAGTIINICDRLFFSTTPARPHSMPWDTDIELRPGDHVITYYLTSANAFKDQDGRVMRDRERNVYILVRYDQIFAARRQDKIITCNGWNLLEPIVDHELKRREASAKAAGLTLPFAGDGVSTKMARILYLAKRNRRYRDPHRYDFEDPLQVGDIVAVRKHGLLPLEFSYHASLQGKKVFYRVQREYIYATIDERVLN